MRKIIIIFLILFNLSPLNASNLFFEEGIKLYKDKNFTKAKFKFEQDIVFNPKNEISYLYLSKIFKEQGDTNQQETNLNTVLLINPKNEEALYNLILLRVEQSNISESENLLKNFEKICDKLCTKLSELKIKIKQI